MLDILEWTLDVIGVTYRRLDGRYQFQLFSFYNVTLMVIRICALGEVLYPYHVNARIHHQALSTCQCEKSTPLNGQLRMVYDKIKQSHHRSIGQRSSFLLTVYLLLVLL